MALLFKYSSSLASLVTSFGFFGLVFFGFGDGLTTGLTVFGVTSAGFFGERKRDLLFWALLGGLAENSTLFALLFAMYSPYLGVVLVL